MVRINQPAPWGFDSEDSYIPISREGSIVGFVKPAYVRQIVDSLNEEEKLHKALQMACYDIVARSGGSTSGVEDLVQQYLAKAERPRSGTAAIALLLKDRQEELDLTDEEFAKFCDTFRLSRNELNNLYAGQEIESQQLSPLSRILGMTMDEVIAAWRGER